MISRTFEKMGRKIIDPSEASTVPPWRRRSRWRLSWTGEERRTGAATGSGKHGEIRPDAWISRRRRRGREPSSHRSLRPCRIPTPTAAPGCSSHWRTRRTFWESPRWWTFRRKASRGESGRREWAGDEGGREELPGTSTGSGCGGGHLVDRRCSGQHVRGIYE